MNRLAPLSHLLAAFGGGVLLAACGGVLLSACGGGDDDPVEDLLDTGWFTDTASFDPETCPHKLVESEPSTGATGWYWRAHPTVSFATDAHDRYELQLADVSGEPVAITPVWNEAGLTAELVFEGGLKASTDYVLTVTDCGERHEIGFRTSDLGLPLDGSPELLEGRTYHLDLVGAEWVEPGGIASLLQLYFTTPVLFGITLADTERVDFLAAPGEVDLFGQLQQDLSQATWDFPIADFTTSPWFDATSDDVLFQFDGNDVPITDFRFAATLSADMTRLGGGELSGLGDTRNLGPLINDDDPNAICTMAASLGVECEPCPDGQPYCLRMVAVGVEGTLIPDLTLQPKN